MELLVYSLCALTIAASGGVLLLLGLRGAQASVINHRLRDYVDQAGAGSQTQESILLSRPRELSGTFRARILIPVFRGLTGMLGSLTPARTIQQLQEQLALAGYPLGLRPREFYGLQFAFTALGVWFAYTLLSRGLAGDGPVGSAGDSSTLLTGLGAVVALLTCYYMPKTWLRTRARRHRDRAAKGLPDALDMLSVCVEAGLGFDQALQRVSEYWRTPLGAELGRVVIEIGMGIPRHQALRNLADRVRIQELSTFVAVILQSDQLGMSIKDTLRAQADQMRVERRFRAQEQARKMPLKMLFPLALLIFPAMFAVILGPSIPVLMDFFATLNAGGR
jgi:tight adherence protein C